jgi:hypothetical protein
MFVLSNLQHYCVLIMADTNEIEIVSIRTRNGLKYNFGLLYVIDH